mgnify:CR=1 FL=1
MNNIESEIKSEIFLKSKAEEIMQSTELYQFIRECRHLHLTKADVDLLKPGDRLDVVIWDRNFEEYWIWDQPQNVPYSPEVFFSENRHQLVYQGGHKWDIEFNFGETIRHPFHLSLEGENTSYTWTSLEGKEPHDCQCQSRPVGSESSPEDQVENSYDWIHITTYVKKDDQSGPPEGWGPIHKHYDDFPTTTRVGWRGPMMLWDRLADLGMVHYHKNFEGLDTSK